MTNDLEATTVLGKANSLIRQLISVPQESVSPVKMNNTDQAGSPRTLAIKRTEVELEYMEEVALIDKSIREKQEE